MMRISSGDIAKFKAALKNYQQAQKKEQKQDEERDRQLQEALSSLGALNLIFSPAVFPWVFLGLLLFLLTKGCGGYV